MKLLFITNGINGPNGLERVLSIKASYMAENFAYEVAILVLNDNHKNLFYKFSPKIHLFSINATGNPLSFLLQYRKGIQEVVNTFQPEIISVCDDGLKGFFLPKLIKTSAKWIYERHASILLNTGNTIKGKIIQTLMQSQVSNFSKFIVLTSGNIREWNKNNVMAIPNPLSFQSETVSELHNKTIITVGSHTWNKGYDLLIQAWEKIEKSFPDWQLKIFGKIDAAQTFVKLAKEKSLKNIHFFEPSMEIQKEYLAASILVLPSRSEGFGMVLIEAMECGLPCIAFNCPSGPADIIKDNEDGFLIENGNITLLTEKMEILIRHPELRKEMGKRAKENVEKYSVAVVLQQWKNLFETI